MPLLVYEIIVPPMIHGLGVMDDYIYHAERLAAGEAGTCFPHRRRPPGAEHGSLRRANAVLCNKVHAHVAKLARPDVSVPVMVVATAAALKAPSDF
jgi:hypothetical protein